MLAVMAGVGYYIILALADPPGLWTFVYGIVYMAMIFVTFIFHIIAHEGGHCIAGLLSGYEFTSFRIFNIMIVKRNGRLIRKKFHLMGTGGQCLMAPPQPFRPDFPYRLYNLAGGLTNFILAAICIAICIPVIAVGHGMIWLLLILFPMVVSGIYCGVTNLFPMIVGGVPNDGWNLVNLDTDLEARRIFWLLLDVMAIINRGGQFRDMPEEWFFTDEKPGIDPETKSNAKWDFSNAFQSGLAVFRMSYLEDTGRLDEAADLAEEILAAGDKVPQIYRYEILCESLFLELIGEGRLDRVEKLYTPELQRYIKATDAYPHRQRLRYAMAMLYHHDEEAAAKALERFKEACKTYPNEGEISSEWESIGLVDCKLAEVNALAELTKEEADLI